MVKGDGVPGGIVGIEVTNKERIIRKVQKEVEIRGVLGGREGGVRGDVEVNDF